MRTNYDTPYLDPIPYDDLIQRWLTWSAEASRNAGYDDVLDLSYISDTPPKLLGRLDPTHFMGHTVLDIEVYVVDELNSFTLCAIYDSFNSLAFLATEVDTTWFTIYTNQNN